MAILDPFSADAFSLQSLVAAINILPNKYGLMESLGMFPFESVNTREINMDEKNGVLNLLKNLPVGSAGQKNSKGTRGVRAFSIPHIPLDDVLLPSEYQGIRGFGKESAFETLANIVVTKLQTMKNKHDITLEFQRMGALKGIVYDADLNVIYDYFKEFVIDKNSVDFELASGSTDVLAKCISVTRLVEDNLKGEVMSGLVGLLSPGMYDAFVSQDLVKTAFDRWMNGEFLRNDYRKIGFQFGGITWKEYRGTATTEAGVTRNFIDTDYGIVFPMGTMDVFSTYCAPADFIETTNTMGRPYYAKQKTRDFERGVDFHTQTNLLPVCKRPGVLIEVYK